MSIRARIWCTLLLAVVLPVGVCLYLMSRAAYQHAVQQADAIHNERAKSLNKSLDSFINVRMFREADTFLRSTHVMLTLETRRRKQWSGNERARSEVREEWQSLNDPKDPRMRWFHQSAPSTSFWHQQRAYPALKNFLLVDENGAPISGSQKPRLYDQNQEDWLQALRNLKDRDILVRWEKDSHHGGPLRVEVLAIARDKMWNRGEGKVDGYLKLNVEFDPILKEYLRATGAEGFDGIITDGNGNIFAALGMFHPMSNSSQLPSSWLAHAGTNSQTTPHLQVTSESRPDLPLLMSRNAINDPTSSNTLGLLVFSGAYMDQIIGPLRAKQWQLFGGTFIVIALGVTASSFYMRKTISRPIEQIAHVTDEIMEHSQRGGVLDEAEVAQLVAPLRKVDTHDEIGMLADHLSKMSVKTLGFQRRMEHEVAEKTRMIQADLEMAREFQQALLPTVCPCCSSQQIHDPLALDFAHIYQPAAYVSGDFYDYLRVNDHQVAVLIGDVMGHGARAAFVTAILRTLIEDVATVHTEPAAFLSALNQRYYEVIQRSGQVVFASACYLLFDTQAGWVKGASAGHPSPLRARRDGSDVAHLFPITQPRFPLGMLGNVQYKSTTTEISVDDLILLYTDGVTEAESGDGEQFGEDALIAQVACHLTRHPNELVCDVADLVKLHALGIAHDDVCMVAIRVLPAAA